jgi:hypothetical protein
MADTTLHVDPAEDSTEQIGVAKGTHAFIPVAFPREQAYFWTFRWQTGEAKAMNDLGLGNFAEFDNSADALRWLRADDD